jgi:hypothetical protein
MTSQRILLEAANPAEIEKLIVQDVNEVLNVVLGETSGTTYENSYTNVAKNAAVQAVLNQVALRANWNPSLRGSNRDDEKGDNARRRYVYLAATVIPPLAKLLLKMAKSTNDKVAIKAFQSVVDYNFESQPSKQSGLRRKNACSQAAEAFNYALMSSLEVCTSSLYQTPVTEQSVSNADLNELYGIVAARLNKVIEIINSMVDVANIRSYVSDQMVTDAAYLTLACSVLRNEIVGSEFRDAAWNDRTAAMAQQLYNIVTKSWSGNTATKAMNKERSDDDYILKSENVVTKNMAELGDNTTQFNLVNNKTKFTCQRYYKIFAIDALSRFSYNMKNSRVGHAVYKVMQRILTDSGYKCEPVFDDQSAANLAKSVATWFQEVSANTQTAISLHYDLLSNLADLSDEAAKAAKLGKEELSKWFIEKGLARADNELDYATFVSAVKNIKTKIVFSGDNEIHGGETADGKEIVNAVGLADAVYTFREESPNDRLKGDGSKSDQVTAGKITERCFEFHDGVLKIAYHGDGPLQDYNIDVDSIDLPRIKEIYTNYVSSSLIPAYVSGGTAWIIMCGLKAFSNIRSGASDDALMKSDAMTREMENIHDANIMQDTRMSEEAKRLRTLNRSDNVHKIATNGFLPSEEADNFGYRTALVDKVKNLYDASDPELLNKAVSNIGSICDNFTHAVSHYAKSAEAAGYGTADDIAENVYKVAPSIDTFVLGKHSAVDKMIASYMATLNSDEGSASDSASVILSANALSDLCKACNVVAYTDGLVKAQQATLLDLLRSSVFFMENFYSAENKASDPQTKQSIASAIQTFNDVNNDKHWFSSFDEFHDKVVDLQTSIIGKNGAKALAKARAAEIKSVYVCVISIVSKNSAQWHDQVKNLVDALMKTPRGKRVEQLRNNLYTVVDKCIDEKGVTQDLLDTMTAAISKTMAGDPKQNKKTLRELRINQYAQRVKVFGMLRYVAGYSKKDPLETAEPTEQAFTLKPGGDPMPEISMFSNENMGRTTLHYANGEQDALVHDASATSDLTAGDHALGDILQQAAYYNNAVKAYQDAGESLEGAIELAKEMPNATPIENENATDDEQIRHWYKVFAENPKRDPSQLRLFQRYIATYDAAKEKKAAGAAALAKIGKDYPCYAGLVASIVDGKVSSDEVEHARNVMNAAIKTLRDLKKYKSYDDIDNHEDPEFREFSYTESDASSIAQVVFMLGEYVLTLHTDTQEDLVESLDNVRGILSRYSGNPLSIKIAQIATNVVKGAESEEDLATKLIQLINRIDQSVINRNEEEVGVPYLSNTRALPRPDEEPQMNEDGTVQPSKYGKAIDSFARSQMRQAPSDEDVAMLGFSDSEEAAARTSYTPLIQKEIDQNPQLAQYAYTLGKAFNAFERVLTDERVDRLSERAFNSVRQSLTGKQLYKGRGANDLQRELVSAMIDDERNKDTSYPTLAEVVKAAIGGYAFKTYNQMYSAVIGSKENILDDKKETAIAFDENGNRTTPEKAYKIPLPRIVALALGDGSSTDVPKVESIKDFAHAIRMDLFKKLTGNYGSIDELTGDVNYAKNYKERATKLMDEAMRSLYELCYGFDTPIADIILVTTTFGQKAGRRAVMKDVGRTFGQSEWVFDLKDALNVMPYDITADQMNQIVEAYCADQPLQIDNERVATAVDVLKDVDGIAKSGEIPRSVLDLGSDANSNDVLIALFKKLGSMKTDDVSWADCVDEIADTNQMDESGDMSDLDKIGVVSGEPNAYPQMMSDEAGEIDSEWISGVTRLLGSVPDSLDKDELMDTVNAYCHNDVAQQRIALNPDKLKVINIINSLLRLDTATGIPTGFFGDTSTIRKQRIRNIFENLIAYKTDDRSWSDCASMLYDRELEAIEKGSNRVRMGSMYPSKAAQRRIAHMRNNPYYSIASKDDYLVKMGPLLAKLREAGILLSDGSHAIFKLKYPGLVFDYGTFNYIAKLGFTLQEKYSLGDDTDNAYVDAFLMALMCVATGVRAERYIQMLASVADLVDSGDNTRQKVAEAVKAITQAFAVEDYGEMVKTSLGWLTRVAFNSMCVVAAASDDGAVQGFKNVFNDITNSSARRSFSLEKVNRNPAEDEEETPETIETGDEFGDLIDEEEIPVDNPTVEAEPKVAEKPKVEKTPKVKKHRATKKASKRETTGAPKEYVSDNAVLSTDDHKYRSGRDGTSSFVSISSDDDEDEPNDPNVDQELFGDVNDFDDETIETQMTSPKKPKATRKSNPKPKLNKDEILASDEIEF